MEAAESNIKQSKSITEQLLNKSSSFENNTNIENVNENGIQITFIPSRRKVVKKINVCIEGEFTINNISLVNTKFKPLFNYYERVSVLLKNISHIDLSAIQFIYTMKYFYSTEQFKIEFEEELSKEDKLLIKQCGFANLLEKPFLTE